MSRVTRARLPQPDKLTLARRAQQFQQILTWMTGALERGEPADMVATVAKEHVRRVYRGAMQ